MFNRIQRDVAARISVIWAFKNERKVSSQKIVANRLLKAVLTDERLWPIVAYRYKTVPFWGILFKCVLILIRIVMGVKIDGQIGPGFSIGHASCIFLNKNIIIGKDVRINQGTIIAGGKKGYPCLGDNVHIAAGAKIIGNISIGDNVHIGANAVVLHDVPGNSTVVGIPAWLVRHNGEKVNVCLKDYGKKRAI